jgi:hypothetical protein
MNKSAKKNHPKNKKDQFAEKAVLMPDGKAANSIAKPIHKFFKFDSIEKKSGKINCNVQESDYETFVKQMLQAFGTSDSDVQLYTLNQVVKTFDGCESSKGFCEGEALIKIFNNAMALLQGVAPRDQMEGLLAAQMIGVHNLAMQTIKRAMISGQSFEGRKANIDYATKMTRTFVAQMEALKKYRSDGQQKVIVEHVHVGQGGQAIVGNVQQGAGGANDNKSE